MKPSRLLVAVTAAIVTALIFYGLGFTWPFVIGWGLLVVVLGLVAQLVVPLEPSADAPHITVEPDRRPTEISRMAWALNTHTGLAGQQVSRRVREILRHRLERRGMNPDDPDHHHAVAALIGPDLWARLTGPQTTIIDVERALDAIDALSPASTAPTVASPLSSGADATFTVPPTKEMT